MIILLSRLDRERAELTQSSESEHASRDNCAEVEQSQENVACERDQAREEVLGPENVQHGVEADQDQRDSIEDEDGRPLRASLHIFLAPRLARNIIYQVLVLTALLVLAKLQAHLIVD